MARELESPFHNVPNDIPLTTFQAEFNEALCAMFAGFHPDSWWDPPAPIPQPLIQEVETENTRESTVNTSEKSFESVAKDANTPEFHYGLQK